MRLAVAHAGCRDGTVISGQLCCKAVFGGAHTPHPWRTDALSPNARRIDF